MILRHLEVQGFRRFDGPISIDFEADRINIIHGPNGTGKSTLLTALTLGLLDTHKAGGKWMEAHRPWGTRLAPRIEVIFDQKGEVFRLSKSFLQGKSAKLEKLVGKSFRPVAIDTEAEDIVWKKLHACSTKGELQGLARVLWPSIRE